MRTNPTGANPTGASKGNMGSCHIPVHMGSLHDLSFELGIFSPLKLSIGFDFISGCRCHHCGFHVVFLGLRSGRHLVGSPPYFVLCLPRVIRRRVINRGGLLEHRGHGRLPRWDLASIHSFHPFIPFIYPSINPFSHPIDYSIHPFHSFIHSFDSSIHYFIPSFLHSFLHSSTHPSNQPTIHPFIRPPIHLFLPSFLPFIHPFAGLFPFGARESDPQRSRCNYGDVPNVGCVGRQKLERRSFVPEAKDNA